jgi:hypothetical protein
LLSVSIAFGQGLENFNNYVGTSGTYSDGTFAGQDGSTWTYTQCRSDRAIVAPSPCLGKNRTPAANVYSGTIPNGCGVISFDYKQGFSTAVDLNLLINGLVVKNVTSPGGNGDTMNVHNSGPVTVNVSGDFVIRFEQANNATSGQVTVDNLTWTSYGGGPLPEPTNYPTMFTATPSPFTINLTWVDATGTQLPTAYLLLGSDEDNIDLPVDGVPEPSDPDLSDGTAAVSVLPGAQAYQFTSLQSNVQYFFKIFPYTNTGSSINYKTDGTPPAASATTPNVTIINYENFNTGTFGTWSKYSVIGDSTWGIDLTHGVGATPCAKVSGYYSGSSHENEDWLISPAMNFNQYTQETFTFQTAKNYTGPDLEVKISGNYDGTGNPNNFTWTPLAGTLSTGGWVWTPSGPIDVSGTSSNAVYIAFKFTSTATESATWEVDEILTTGIHIVGVPETGAGISSFSILPNPSDGTFRLVFGDNAAKDVRILSVVGREVYSAGTSGTTWTVSLPELPSGVYFVRVNQAGSANAEVKKLIIR